MKKKFFGHIALLAPLWVFILQSLYKYFGFNSKIFCVLCVIIVLLCVVCLLLDIIFVTNKGNILPQNRKYIIWAISIAIILFLSFLVGAYL